MQRPQSRDDLLRVLENSHLVSAVQLSEIRQAASDAPDAAAAAERMVETGILTRWQVDQLLAGRSKFYVDKYKLIDQLGQGGMGAVFLAEHAVMGRRVALKVLSKARLASNAAVQRFRREVKAAAKLDHPNIIAAHDAGEIRGVHFLVMEHVSGSDLYAWHKQYGRLPIAWSCEFIRQAALGLEHAHRQGMVHRDIKPGNILVCWDDPSKPPAVKILDLGLARFTHEADIQDSVALSESADGGLTQVGQILGTPDYLAPEQIRKTHDVDIRADIFSLGCTLFKLITGQTPFGGRNIVEKLQARIMATAPPAVGLRTLRDDAPEELESIVARMLDRDPDRRYQTPAEVAEVLVPFAWRPGMPVSVLGAREAVAGVLPVTPSIDVTASRFAKDMDSGTRTFLGSLADEASDLEAMVAPPVATPMQATPVTPVPVAGQETKSFGDVSTASRMMSLRQRKQGSPAALFGVGIGVAVVLLLLLMFATGSVEQPAAAERPAVEEKPKNERPIEPAAWQPQRPRTPPPDVFPPDPVPPDETPRDGPGFVAGLPITSDWKPGQPIRIDESPGQANPPWKPGQPFPIDDLPAGDLPAPPPKSAPPRKSEPLPRSVIKFNPAQQSPADQSSQPLKLLEGHADEVTAVAFSRDGKRIVSGSADTTLRVWQWEEDQPPLVLKGHQNEITDVTFLHVPHRVASASRDRTILVWDAIRGDLRNTRKGHTAPVAGLAALGTSPLISFGADGVRSWQVSGTSRRHQGPSQEIIGIGYTTTGPRALYRESSGMLRCFQPATGEEKFRVGGMPQPTCAAFTLDGRFLAIGSSNGWLYLIDITDNRKAPRQDHAHSGGVLDVTFGPGGAVISGGADGTVRLQRPQGVSVFRGHTGSVRSVDASPDGKLLVSGGEDKTVRVWEVK